MWRKKAEEKVSATQCKATRTQKLTPHWSLQAGMLSNYHFNFSPGDLCQTSDIHSCKIITLCCSNTLHLR